MTEDAPSAMLWGMADFDPPTDSHWRPLSNDLGEDSLVSPLSRQQMQRWTLVLQARRIPWRSERQGAGFLLWVPVGQYQRALSELRQHEQENRDWPPPPPPPSRLADNTLASVSVLIALATFHNLTLLGVRLAGHNPVDWIGLGSAHAGRILSGEYWRLVTALTLHADGLHLLGNILIGGVFIVRLARDLGSGLAWTLLLGAGALGNLINAALQHPDHRAVGASTAVFGAVGILAALSLVRYRRNLRRRWPLPVAAALALLALLGTGGENTDLGAHLFGFACGLALGLATGPLITRRGRPGRSLNAALASASALTVLAAWAAALLLGG